MDFEEAWLIDEEEQEERKKAKRNINIKQERQRPSKKTSAKELKALKKASKQRKRI